MDNIVSLEESNAWILWFLVNWHSMPRPQLPKSVGSLYKSLEAEGYIQQSDGAFIPETLKMLSAKGKTLMRTIK